MNYIVRIFTSLVQRYLPDPFVFAIILTIIVFALSRVLTPHSSLDLLQMWVVGFGIYSALLCKWF